VAAEAADGAFLEGDEGLVGGGEPQDQVAVERLGEAGVGHGGADAAASSDSAALSASWRRVPSDRSATPDPRGPRGPCRSPGAGGPVDLHAHALAAGEAEGDGAVVVGRGGHDHAGELGFVRGGHDGEAGEVGEIGHVEAARMGRAVRRPRARAVDGEADGEALDGHVVDHLVVAALQEGRVDRAEGRRPPAARRRRRSRRAARRCHVEAAVGEAVHEPGKARAVGMAA
jgi:hypothetical protein